MEVWMGYPILEKKQRKSAVNVKLKSGFNIEVGIDPGEAQMGPT
jgi:hypothetical protein